MHNLTEFKLKRFVYLLILLGIIISGCIRHSDEGLNKKFKGRVTKEKSNYKKISANLMSSDINASIKFYKKILDLDLTVVYPDSANIDFAILSKGSIEIMLQRKESMIEEFPEMIEKDMTGGFNLYIEVNDILMIYEKAISSAQVVKELHQTLWGTKEFSIKDYDGHIITFGEALKK
jgi:uncharacterized glyoxalase superfamily protein PhnB